MHYVCGNCGAEFANLPAEGRCTRCGTLLRQHTDSQSTGRPPVDAVPPKKPA